MNFKDKIRDKAISRYIYLRNRTKNFEHTTTMRDDSVFSCKWHGLTSVSVNKSRNLAKSLSCRIVDRGGNGKWIEQNSKHDRRDRTMKLSS
jgi:hypothetical protein